MYEKQNMGFVVYTCDKVNICITNKKGVCDDLHSATFVHEGLRAVRVSTSDKLNGFTKKRPSKRA